MGGEEGGVQSQLARVVEGGGARFNVDTGKCHARSATLWYEGGCKCLRVYFLVQFGKSTIVIKVPSITDRCDSSTIRVVSCP